MFKSFLNSKLISIGAAAIIAAGVIGAASVALADEPANPGAPGQHGGNHPGKHPRGFVLGAVLKNAGVTREELQQGAKEGKTFGEIITAYGDKSVAQAKADALAALDSRLAAAVAAGKLTQAKADKIKSEAPAAFDKFMAAKPGAHKADNGRRRGKFPAIGKDAFQTTADTLGITTADLMTQLRDGKSIAEIAGPKTGAVITALTTKANAAIDKAVADGKLTAEQGAAAKSKAGDVIEKFVNHDHPGKGLRGLHGKRHPNRN